MEKEIQKRTKDFALTVIRFTEKLGSSRVNNILANQIIRSCTSIGANYIAACYAKSQSDFLNKLKIVEEEATETKYWLELIKETNLNLSAQILAIMKESDELIAIFSSTVITMKKKLYHY
ncbi:MAG: hypothetical protein A2231_07605 [Candidatus Firestonebacteria bacterium RIFOXYA2_FULL_40_8]|nr:MAG: hypothetical protein A2231_07605 [Candidatus Firestonebacteria bacterium RIFOXYA2_FULL_40_8]